MTQRAAAAAGSNCVFDSPSGSNPIYMLRQSARLKATFNLRNSLEIIYNIFAVACASYHFPLPLLPPLLKVVSHCVYAFPAMQSHLFLFCSLNATYGNATLSIFGHKMLTAASTKADFRCQVGGGGNFMLCVAQIKKFLPRNFRQKTDLGTVCLSIYVKTLNHKQNENIMMRLFYVYILYM